MKSLCFAYPVIFVSTIALTQTYPVPLINQGANAGSSIRSSQADPKAQAKILDSYGKLPLSFEANQGQTDSQVKFLSRGGGYTLFLTGDEAVFSLRGSEAKGETSPAGYRLHPKAVAPTGTAVMRMKLVQANHATEVTGLDELPGRSNYFIGNDPKKWHGNVPNFAKVKYEGIYKGIDLIYYGNRRELEYDFVVGPGADPSRIAFEVRGARRIRRDEHGDLVFKTGISEIRWRRPVVYQENNGKKREIAAHYVIKDKNLVTFWLSKYDTNKPLYIDPLMIYSTYLGGSNSDFGSAIAVDSSGNAYVTGYASSTNFPTMNPLQPAYGGGNADAFVAEISASGSALVYSTYLGGSGEDQGSGIAVDSSGNVYVTGFTSSTNFPMMNPLQPANGGDTDAFVTEISAGGSALIYSTYLGGSSYDFGSAIAVDSSGDAYVTGYTYSTNFPTMNPLQPKNGGTVDAFVTKINAGGSEVVYSTYLGGSGEDQGSDIAVDASGSAYVTGNTVSTNFPTLNPLQPANGGETDAFVAKIEASGAALVYSTYLGGHGVDQGLGITVDSSDNAYVTGSTASTNFPTLNPLQPANGGDVDAFVTEINAAGSALIYSTYLGGSGNDIGYGIAVDSAGNTYVTGMTSSSNFPTMNPLQAAYGGGSEDAFVTEINSGGSALIYSTYLGGSGDDVGYGITVDSAGNAYVAGFTSSSNFPTLNPVQPTNDGTANAFITEIGLFDLRLTPTSVKFGTHQVDIKSLPKTITLTNKGIAAVSISGISIIGADAKDFAETNTCGKSLAAGASCLIKVTFKPTAKGKRSADVSIRENGGSTSQKVSLTGTGD